MSSNRYLVQAVKLFSTLFFVLLKKKGFHLFVLKVVMTCFIWVSLKILEKLKNDKNVLCATFLVHSKGIVRKKEMINLREFEEKL